jgi:hypothetical protein
MPQWASGRKDDQGESGISPCPPQAPLRQSPKVELFSKTSCQKSRTNSLYTYHSFSYCICTLISHNSIYGLFKSSFQIDSCWFTASLYPSSYPRKTGQCQIYWAGFNPAKEQTEGPTIRFPLAYFLPYCFSPNSSDRIRDSRPNWVAA